MAKNRVYGGETDTLRVTAPGATSGAPVVVGKIPGVALVDADANNKTTIAFRGVFKLAVHGYNGTANAAVAAGDAIYYDAGAATTKLNVNTAGVLFGYALEAVASGATTTIEVLLAM